MDLGAALDDRSELRRAIATLGTRVQSAVRARRQTGAADPGEVADLTSLAGEGDEGGSDSSPEGEPVELRADARLGHLLDRFGIDEVDLEVLLVALAPEVDPRFEVLYGFLHGDRTRGRASVGLALELTGRSRWSAADRDRFAPWSGLVGGGLLEVLDPDRPLPARGLRVPERVVRHLLGGDEPDALVSSAVVPTVAVAVAGADRLAEGLGLGIPFAWVRERPGAAGLAVAAEALARLDRPALAVDLDRVPDPVDVGAVVAASLREARLRGGGLILTGVRPPRHLPVVAGVARGGAPTVLVSPEPWDPAWSTQVPVLLDAPEPTERQREAVWAYALARHELDDDDRSRALARFRMTPERILLASDSAVLQAAVAGEAVDERHLLEGISTQNAGRLTALALRLRPRATFDDVVAPDALRAELRGVIDRVRTQELVTGQWGVGGARRGRGVTCLFSGPSGTGKSLSAEAIAGELGFDMYRVDLSQLVDKYIGETEKNLERLFTEAEGVNGVLFFDEADAIFGKRTEVRDSHDRHANVEVAYLLQRMEDYDGIVVLATNLAANLDEAFTRRIDVVCQFRKPDPAERRRLWTLHLPDTVPLADDVDLDLLAEAADLSGGLIRNATLTAAYGAAARDRAVSMADLVRAVGREYQKAGRLIDADRFGAWSAELP